VYLVYSNAHLLARDKKNFEEVLRIASIAPESVCFQLGFNFEKQPDDVLVVDEADSLLFSDPLTFQTFLGDSPCICLTATPDDQDIKGTEKFVVDKLGFTRFAPILPQA
jgi:hypothetical protein